MVLSSKLPENSLIECVFGSFEHSESPQIASIHAGYMRFITPTKEARVIFQFNLVELLQHQKYYSVQTANFRDLLRFEQ